jgi:hypothetical protein
MVEGDDVRGRGVVKEVGVDLGDGFVADDRGLHLGQMQQGRVVVFDMLEHQWHGPLHGMEQPSEIAVMRRVALVKTDLRDDHAAGVVDDLPLRLRRRSSVGTDGASRVI